MLVRQSWVLTESTVGDGASIGPFAHLRPGSEIGEEAHVGNFVETKKAKLGKGAKANHLTYLGDAEVGERSNIGAGTITCNYDGVNKHTTRIGKDAFIGSDSTLVAPVEVGDGAYVGAGSCITKDVPADALAVSRARQFVKEGWAAARRANRRRSRRGRASFGARQKFDRFHFGADSMTALTAQEVASRLGALPELEDRRGRVDAHLSLSGFS